MLTSEQVLALAPDAGAAKAGRELANRRRWVSLNRQADSAIWGECQGSGSTPYRTQVDLGEPAFKCSCPSRKFPCKHGLGLLLLFTADPAPFTESAPPDWVQQWLASRSERAQKQVEKVEKAEKSPDPAAQAKRAAQREQRIQDGIDDLDRWLRDLMRSGLATANLRYQFWDSMAARLVDSQAPGLARMVREMSGLPASGAGWQERLVERLGLLYLTLQGYRRAGALPPDAAADVRSLIGWTASQEEILAGPGVSDRWMVIGQRTDEEDRLQVRRSWLIGERTGRGALVLQFAHGSQPIESAGLIPGSAFPGEIVYFPGAYPLRALVKSRDGDSTPAVVRGFASAADVFTAYGDALARYPWLEGIPIALENCVPMVDAGRWTVVDTDRNALDLTPAFQHGWRLLAVSGGHPVTVYGEWNGVSLLPLGVRSDLTPALSLERRGRTTVPSASTVEGDRQEPEGRYIPLR